jgi:hypothetical protein
MRDANEYIPDFADRPIEYVSNIMDGRYLPARCGHCAKDVAASVRFSLSYSQDDNHPETLHHLAICPHCDNVILLQEINFGGSDRHIERLYPPEDLKLHRCIQHEVSVSFDEARSCYRAGAFVACALMCRKTIEALYKTLGIKAKNLQEGLKELSDKCHIEPGMLAWGHALRNLGNVAAHDIFQKISQEQAESILEFTFGLVEYTLRYRPRFERFAERLNSDDFD